LDGHVQQTVAAKLKNNYSFIQPVIEHWKEDPAGPSVPHCLA
jgi:hypothetical protein